VYIDPNAEPPGTRITRPSTAPAAGVVGAGLRDLVEAATAGNLRVDPATGAATIQAIHAVKDQVDALRRLGTQPADGLGGGYARQVDQFNEEWTVRGSGSAAEVMEQFSEQLDRLVTAVEQSMATYLAADESGARHLEQVRPDFGG